MICPFKQEGLLEAVLTEIHLTTKPEADQLYDLIKAALPQDLQATFILFDDIHHKTAEAVQTQTVKAISCRKCIEHGKCWPV